MTSAVAVPGRHGAFRSGRAWGFVGSVAVLLLVALAMAADTAVADTSLSGTSPAAPEVAGNADAELWWHNARQHLQANRPRAAIPYLDALLRGDPGNSDYRADLGYALYLTGQFDRARYHLDRVLAGPLTDAQRRAVEALIERIDHRRDWTVRLGLAVVPESNPLRRTRAEVVSIGGMDFVLGPGALEASGTGLQLGADLAWAPWINPRLRGRFALSATGRFYRDSTLNDIATRIEAGVLVPGDGGRMTGAGLSLQHRHAGGRTLNRGPGVYVTHQQRLSRQTSLSLRGEYARLRYPGAPLRDGSRSGGEVTLSHAVSPRLSLHGSVIGWRTSSVADFETGTEIGLRFGGQYTLEGGLTVAADVTHLRNHRDGVAPLFGVRRQDERTDIRLRLQHSGLAAGGFVPVLELVQERQHSNIGLYRFTNRRVSMGLSRQY